MEKCSKCRYIVITPEHINPEKYDNTKEGRQNYYREVNMYNIFLQNSASLCLQKVYGEMINSSSCIYTLGSDGRLEKGVSSPLEIKIIYDNKKISSSVLKYISAIFVSTHGKGIYDVREIIPFKDNYEGVYYCAYNGKNTNIIFPSRAFDSIFLMGNESMDSTIKECIENEIKNHYSYIKKYIDKRIREAKKLIREGSNKIKGETMIHFDMDRGVLYYDEKGNIKALSTKQGHLRYVQYNVEKMILNAIYRKISFKEFKKEDPKTTINRLDWLKESIKNISLSYDEIEDIKDHYLYFLYYYHLSQYNYKYKNNKCVVVKDVNEFKKRSFELLKLLSGGVIVEH